MTKKTYAQERRQYIRLHYVFPVEIYLKEPGSTPRLIQSFTRDVSLGGLCLSVNDPDERFVKMVEGGLAAFDIAINLPFSVKPIEARVRAAWHELKNLTRHKQLLIGVAYEKIEPRESSRVVSRARRMKWVPRITAVSAVILACLLGLSLYESHSLRERNRELIERFYKARETSDVYKRSYGKIEAQYDALAAELRKNEEAISRLKSEIRLIAQDPAISGAAEKTSQLEEELKNSLAGKALVEERLAATRDRRGKAQRLFTEAKGKRSELEEAMVKNMFQWLKTHQNKFTGLVISFEGDPAVKDRAFTYDQSLASQVFLLSKDFNRASSILEFYRTKARRKDGGFMNAYNAVSSDPAEDTVHAGPTLWIGIAAAQYTHMTGDNRFLGLAREVADWAVSLKDPEGGIKGGRGIAWYSTEHNLDAYALFNMLYGLTKDERYRSQRDGTLKWIKENTYSKKDAAMKRGKGDATIATDTLAWAIAAIGPAALSREGMDPEGIVKFAEDECAVTAEFTRPDGETVMVRGFDFAKAKNAPRGGIVSSEWTAQMAMAFKIMATFYSGSNEPRKSEEYSRKAEEYLGELDKMVISSPSPSGQGAGCLPYATQANADTGHGWRTPSGAQTGSVSGTAYTIFAKKGYNPLSLE